MAKGKKGGFFGRLVWTILVVGVFALGAILFLSTLPTVGVTVNYTNDFGLLKVSMTLAFLGMGVLFGGPIDDFKYSATFNDGKPIEIEVDNYLDSSFNFNYFVLIALVLALLGVLVFVFMYKNKKAVLLASLLLIVAGVMLCLDGVVFPAINSDVLNLPEDVEGLSVLDLPSLLFGLCVAASGVLSLVKGIFTRK